MQDATSINDSIYLSKKKVRFHQSQNAYNVFERYIQSKKFCIRFKPDLNLILI